MENTFLPELPNSQEAGEYLALDLGGTNFRVMYSRLHDGAAIEEKVEVRTGGNHGKGRGLFSTSKLVNFLQGFIQTDLRPYVKCQGCSQTIGCAYFFLESRDTVSYPLNRAFLLFFVELGVLVLIFC